MLAASAAAWAAWSGWSWYAAAHDDGLRYAATRDRVLRAAEQEAQNLNTLDYRHLDASLKLWLDSTTGDLHDQIAQGGTAFRAQVVQARTVTSARVLEAAVTELDEHSGRAGVLLALSVTVTPPQGAPATKPARLVARLGRTPQGWRLAELGQAAS